MTNKSINYGWDFFEDIYENTLKKGQTFSYEMGEEIKKELEYIKNTSEKQMYINDLNSLRDNIAKDFK